MASTADDVVLHENKFKRAFDVVVAGLLLLFILPVFGILYFVIRLDGGPFLFRHERVGASGRVFRCLKFRTMVPDSEGVLASFLRDNPAAAVEWRESHKLRQDPRVTWIGRILRSTSLDEVPQLLNVIRNEMSLVGPRPITACETRRYGPYLHYYQAALPGITGLWQVSGRSSTSYERRVELDVRYVSQWSMRTDFSILLRTVPAVVLRRGAH